jgi:hypothetical protein
MYTSCFLCRKKICYGMNMPVCVFSYCFQLLQVYDETRSKPVTDAHIRGALLLCGQETKNLHRAHPGPVVGPERAGGETHPKLTPKLTLGEGGGLPLDEIVYTIKRRPLVDGPPLESVLETLRLVPRCFANYKVRVPPSSAL